MSCDFCNYEWLHYRKLIELAKYFDRHALLLKCPKCETLYELFPEERGMPRELTEEEARALFSGAL